MSIKPFIPDKLPLKVNYALLVKNIAKAHRSIASLDASLKHLPNPELLGRTMQTKEAVLSSKIEGTQASMNEVFEYEARLDKKENSEKKRDIQEIMNYRKALNYGIRNIENKQISSSLIKKLHSILLTSARGRHKKPGNFRKGQVYIGKYGASIKEATYIPPPPGRVPSLLKNFEEYINSDSEKDKLVQIALAHYQFEAIHPFLDGNGRVGRLLISLFLFRNNLISHPFLYLSEFFEENRQDYYALLNGVSEIGDIESWLNFFLYALATQAEKTEDTSNQILSLYDELKDKITEVNSKYAINLLDAIFIYPVFSTASIRKESKIKNTQTFFTLINKFVKQGIIKEEKPTKKRNQIFIFEKLVKILNR